MRHALFLLSLAFSASVFSQAAPNALSGVVSSAEEGAMEGVLVSAKKAGSTITVRVASDTQGHYGFPASKLEPGKYSLKVRAVGFDVDDVSVTIVKGKAATADLKLGKAKDLAAQLSNVEWI